MQIVRIQNVVASDARGSAAFEHLSPTVFLLVKPSQTLLEVKMRFRNVASSVRWWVEHLGHCRALSDDGEEYFHK